jgi:hypothetical protein
MAFTFRLYVPDGEDIGTFKTAVSGPWNIGHQFMTGDHHRFEIVDKVENDAFVSDEFAGAFVVTPLELAEP